MGSLVFFIKGNDGHCPHIDSELHLAVALLII